MQAHLTAALLLVAAACAHALGVVYVSTCNNGVASNGPSGGVHTLFELHHTLRRLGMRSALVGGIEAYRDKVLSNFTSCATFRLDQLGPADVLVLPEQRAMGRDDDAYLRALEARGQPAPEIIVYFVGQHRPYDGYESAAYYDAKRVAIGDYLAGVFAVGRAARWHRPLAAEYYAVPERVSRSLDAARPRLVLYDDDFEFALERFRAALPDAEFVRLHGLAQSEVRDLYSRARVLVDLHVPGLERAVYESAMYGVVPVVGRVQNGRSDADFPAVAKVDPWDVDAQVAAVRAALDGYAGAYAAAAPLRAHVESWRTDFSRQLADYFGNGDVTFALQVNGADDADALIPFAASVLLQHPFALVEALVPDVGEVRLDRIAGFAALARAGLASSLKLVGVGAYLETYPQHATMMRGVRNRQRRVVCHVDTPHLVLASPDVVRALVEALELEGSDWRGGVVDASGHLVCTWAGAATAQMPARARLPGIPVAPVRRVARASDGLLELDGAPGGADTRSTAACGAWRALAGETAWRMLAPSLAPVYASLCAAQRAK